MEKYYEQNHHARVQGDIKDLLTKYTDIKLPAKDPGSYTTLRYLTDVFNMLTFDGSEEEKPMGVIAGSYPSYIGNLHNIFFFLSTFKTKNKTKMIRLKKEIQNSKIRYFLVRGKKNDFIALRV